MRKKKWPEEHTRANTVYKSGEKNSNKENRLGSLQLSETSTKVQTPTISHVNKTI